MRIAKSVRRLVAYVPGEQPKSKKVVKLNTNENPYPPSPKCGEVLKGFDLDLLRRYPDPVFGELRAALAKLNRTVPERIFVGNGSDEVLAVAAKAFVESDERIGSLDPSYSLYRTLAAIRDVPWWGQGFGACGGAACGALSAAAVPQDVALYILTNPNAPTGEFREPEEVAAFAKKFKGVTLVDEAYADFARNDCMALATAEDNRNVLVMRTFSKSYSLAGLRVGYCVGPTDLIEAMYKVKDSYNVDAIAQRVAIAAVKDQRWMKANVAKILATRAWCVAAFEKRGWDVIPSESNFLFAKPPSSVRAATVFERLREKRIFVRYFTGPKTADRLRVTVGTDAQMKKLFKALDELAN